MHTLGRDRGGIGKGAECAGRRRRGEAIHYRGDPAGAGDRRGSWSPEPLPDGINDINRIRAEGYLPRLSGTRLPESALKGTPAWTTEMRPNVRSRVLRSGSRWSTRSPTSSLRTIPRT